MRIIYPDKINKECDAIMPYIERMTIDRCVFKEGTPKSIIERYDKLIVDMREFDKKCV